MRWLIVCLIFLLPSAVSLAQLGLDTDTADKQVRPVGPDFHWGADSLETFDPAWLHLKFVEGSDIQFQADPDGGLGHFVGPDGQAIEEVNQLLAGANTIRRTFPGDRAKYRDLKARGEAASGKTGPDLSLWFDVQLANDRAGLANTINALNDVADVEIAHPAPICDTATIHAPDPLAPRFSPWLFGTPDFTNMQDYLYQTPVGLDAPSAWAVPGGRGTGMKFIDVELGWSHQHEDFDQNNLFHNNNNNDASFRDHGTAVVGEVVGDENSFGVTGFASDAEWGTVGILIGEWPNVPHRFMEAAEALDPGDIWLIELQMFPPGRDATPMEWLQVNFDAIWTSSWSLNVVCVEAGANGTQDLDAAHWNGLFDRNVRDSGAIMVGAGTPTGRVAEWFTNWGSRMDVHAWGSEIVTTGYGDLYTEGTAETEYTASFGGTSGASPMVVGSGLCLQGIARAQSGSPLNPVDLRALLNSTGIAHLDPSKNIGPRPDIAAAIDQLPSLDPVCAGDGTLVEGTAEINDFNSACGSDNTRWGAHGTSLFYQVADPVVQFELIATAPSGVGGGTISVDIEASKQNNNATLILRAQLFNFTTGSYVALPGVMPLATTDATQNFALLDDADPSEFIEPGTNDVRLSLQTIQTAGVANVRTRLDEVLFNFN